MHLLMLSLDSSILTQEIGDSRQRHLEYARRAGHISMIICSTRRFPDTRLSPELAVYPAYTRTRFLYPWASYQKALQIHKKNPVDVITAQEPFLTGLAGVWLKKKIRRPLDVQNHSSFIGNKAWLNEKPLQNRLLLQLAKYVLPRADCYRVVNHGQKAAYQQELGLAADRIDVCYVPTDLTKFTLPIPPEEIADLKKSLGLGDEPLALWVGRPVLVKRIDLLLEAFAQVHQILPTAKLLLVGDFSGTPEYQAQVQNSSLRDAVIFVGAVPYDRLPAYYALADVFVLSSIYEGFGRVIVEAMAAGKPVISTDNEGSRELITPGKTGLMTPFDAGALAEGILSLLNNRDLARQMGVNARQEMIERFDPSRQIDELVEHWRRCAG